MIKVNEKTAKSFTKIVKQRDVHCWNLYNPMTAKLLKSNDLKAMNARYFKDRPDSWNKHGVIDATGVDWEYNMVWLQRVEMWFNDGYYLCSGADLMLCDCVNCGYNIDETGKVIPFGQ